MFFNPNDIYSSSEEEEGDNKDIYHIDPELLIDGQKCWIRIHDSDLRTYDGYYSDEDESEEQSRHTRTDFKRKDETLVFDTTETFSLQQRCALYHAILCNKTRKIKTSKQTVRSIALTRWDVQRSFSASKTGLLYLQGTIKNGCVMYKDTAIISTRQMAKLSGIQDLIMYNEYDDAENEDIQQDCFRYVKLEHLKRNKNKNYVYFTYVGLSLDSLYDKLITTTILPKNHLPAEKFVLSYYFDMIHRCLFYRTTYLDSLSLEGVKLRKCIAHVLVTTTSSELN